MGIMQTVAPIWLHDVVFLSMHVWHMTAHSPSLDMGHEWDFWLILSFAYDLQIVASLYK